jgi:hypothetical protein
MCALLMLTQTQFTSLKIGLASWSQTGEAGAQKHASVCSNLRRAKMIVVERRTGNTVRTYSERHRARDVHPRRNRERGCR